MSKNFLKYYCVEKHNIQYQGNQVKKIHLSNFRKKYDDKSYQIVKDAIGKNSFAASEINIQKIVDNISDPVVKKNFTHWSDGYDFAILN